MHLSVILDKRRTSLCVGVSVKSLLIYLIHLGLGNFNVYTAENVYGVCELMHIYCSIIGNIHIEIFVYRLNRKRCAAERISVCDFLIFATVNSNIAVSQNRNDLDVLILCVNADNHNGITQALKGISVSCVNAENSNVEHVRFTVFVFDFVRNAQVLTAYIRCKAVIHAVNRCKSDKSQQNYNAHNNNDNPLPFFESHPFLFEL